MLQPFYKVLENYAEIYGAGKAQSTIREFYYRAIDIVENETMQMLRNLLGVAELQAYDAGFNWTEFFDDTFAQFEYQCIAYETQLKQNEQQIDASYALLKKEYLLDHASQPTIHMDLHRMEKICKDYSMMIDKCMNLFTQMSLIQCYIGLRNGLRLTS
jgi:hypothetical protein